jgi:hypothetical protein
MYTLGLDVPQRSATYCLLDDYGQVVETRTVHGHWHQLIDQLAQWQQPLQVVYEASLGYGPIHQRLTSFCRRVVVAHPKKLKWLFRSRPKNDKVDAKKLAKLLYLDEVPAPGTSRASIPGEYGPLPGAPVDRASSTAGG